MILDFDTYNDLGGAIQDETQYERYAMKADALIGRITHGRIQDESPARKSAQYAAFDVIEAMYADAQSAPNGKEIASMSNDGVSVSYATGSGSAAQEHMNRYAGIARVYLETETDAHGTPLLYAGVDA